LLTGLALAAMAACAGSDRGQTGGSETAVRGGTVVVAGPNDLGGLNGLVASESYTMDVNLHLLYLPLVAVTADVGFEPALAESWQWQGDTAVTFHLRRDVRWHDGRPTTAHDVVFTFDRLKDPVTAFPASVDFELWLSAEAVDSFTIRARLQPHLDPLLAWAFLPIMPEHALGSIAPAGLRNAAFNHAPIGNGPFRFVEYRANDRWVFEANPDFPEALGGRPWIDRDRLTTSVCFRTRCSENLMECGLSRG
jgi:peptide/nickel transport system substrate-binding protein